MSGDFTGHDMAQACEEAYETGVQDSMLRATQYERILSDLIAELRDQVEWYPPDVFPDFTDDDPASQSRTPDRIAGVAMRDAWTRAAQMADRAEVQLRTLQTPGGPAGADLTNGEGSGDA